MTWKSTLLFLLTFFLAAFPATAQESEGVMSGGVFEITRSTIDGGGSTDRSTGSIIVRGTIGQADVGAYKYGTFYLTGGFWATQGRTGIFFSDGFETGDVSVWSGSTGLTFSATTTTPTTTTPKTAAATPQAQSSEVCSEDENCQEPGD